MGPSWKNKGKKIYEVAIIHTNCAKTYYYLKKNNNSKHEKANHTKHTEYELYEYI